MGIKGKLKKNYNRFVYGQCAILLYHRVSELETDPQLLSVSPGNFNSHLKHLKNNYNILNVGDFLNHLSNRKKMPARSVLITFDDGYYDNFTLALPVLEQNKIQSLFYISTGNLNTANEFWWDEVERALLLSPGSPLKFKLNLNNEDIEFPTGFPDDKRNSYNSILSLLRNVSVHQRTVIINELIEWSGNVMPRASHRSMTFEEVEKMAQSEYVVIGAHTHNHPSLSHLGKDEQAFEIKKSKDILENITGNSIVHFSYPFGTKRDYDKNTIEICRREGFEMVSSNYPEVACSMSDIFQLPRFLVRNVDENKFSDELKKIFS